MKFLINNVSALILICIVTFFAYRQAFEMTFWHDDYTHLYYAQNQIVQRFPYQYFGVWIPFLYKHLGLNHSGWMIVGLCLYIFNSFLLYIFLKNILKHRYIAILGSLIFTSGYTGMESLRMLIGDGIPTLIATSAFLGMLIAFLRFKELNSLKNFAIVIFFFILALDFLPSRYASVVMIVIGLDLILISPLKKKLFLVRSLVYLSIYLLIYLAHPSKYIFDYPLLTKAGANVGSFSDQINYLLSNFKIHHIVVQVGTFWNTIFPSTLQDDFFIFISKDNWTNRYLANSFVSTFIYAFPSTVISFYTITYLRLVYPNKLRFNLLVKLLLSFLVFTFLWGIVATSSSMYLSHTISIINGGVLLLLFLVLSLMKFNHNPHILLAGLIILFGNLGMFYFTQPEFVLDSPNRYLLPASVMVPLVLTVFISSYSGKGIKLFASFAFILIFSHLILGNRSHTKFVNDYSIPSKNIFSSLSSLFQNSQEAKYIYLEGDTKESNFAVGDTFRVGELKSEVALATYYDTPLDKITLVEKPQIFRDQLKKNSSIELANFHYFIYSDDGLIDYSNNLRGIIKENRKYEYLPHLWNIDNQKYELSTNIPSNLPMQLRIFIKTNSSIESLNIRWEYASYGSLTTNKSEMIKVPNKHWNEYDVGIPGASSYLRKIIIESEGVLDIGKASIFYINN